MAKVSAWAELVPSTVESLSTLFYGFDLVNRFTFRWNVVSVSYRFYEHMKIILSKHAQKRMVERHILKSEVKDALLDPDRSGKQDHKHFAMKTRKNGQLLIVYYLNKHGDAFVITVISTSKTSKYLS